MLRSFSEWKNLTNDLWILQTVQGYVTEFDMEPFQSNIPKPIKFSKEEEELVDKEVLTLFGYAITLSHTEPDQFISNIFLVLNPNGKFRPVINLKQLNNFVHYEHFNQQTLLLY